MTREIIAVDGLAGSGKTALAKGLATTLGWTYFSTGTLYRAVGYLALQQGVSLDDEPALLKVIERAHLGVVPGPDRGAPGILANGTLLAAELVTPAVSEAASRVAVHPAVRSALIPVQRQALPGESLVVEGRDVGTVVFPDALTKFFIEVPVEVRIARRLHQLQAAGSLSTDPESIKLSLRKEIIERDSRDQHRTTAPTVAANDAVLVDNSTASLEETVARLANICRKHFP